MNRRIICLVFAGLLLCLSVASLLAQDAVQSFVYDSPPPAPMTLSKIAEQAGISGSTENALILELRSRPSEKAVALMQKLVAVHPERADLLAQLALLQFKLSEYGEALVVADKALAIAPLEPWALLVKALVHQQRYHQLPALEAYEQLLKADLTAFKDYYITADVVRICMAHAWLRAREKDSALKAVEPVRATAVKGNDLLTLTLLERFYVQAEEPDLARKLYEDILKDQPQNLNARLQMGKLALQAGRIDDALPWLQGVAKEKPDLLQPHFYLFLAWYFKGAIDQAQQELNLCGKMDWRAQAKAEENGGELSPYPDCKAIFSYVCLARGDWRNFGMVQKEILHDDITANALPLIKEDIFGESMDQDCLNFQLETQGEVGTDFGPILFGPGEEMIRLKNKKADKILMDTAYLLRHNKFAEALKLAEEGMKLVPENPRGLIAQAMVAAKETGDFAKAYKYYERLIEVARNEEYSGIKEHFQWVFKMFAAPKAYMKKIWLETNNWLSVPVEVKFQVAYQAIDAMRRESDSIFEKTALSMVLANFAYNHYRFDIAAKEFERYLDYDPDINILRWIHGRFGRYFGF